MSKRKSVGGRVVVSVQDPAANPTGVVVEQIATNQKEVTMATNNTNVPATLNVATAPVPTTPQPQVQQVPQPAPQPQVVPTAAVVPPQIPAPTPAPQVVYVAAPPVAQPVPATVVEDEEEVEEEKAEPSLLENCGERFAIACAVGAGVVIGGAIATAIVYGIKSLITGGDSSDEA